MSSFASFLRVPFWLEKAWQETRVQPHDSLPEGFDPHEADTVPLPLHELPARQD